MELNKPLDFLNNLRNDRVFVELKNGWLISGALKAFDIHVNLVLNDVEAKRPVRNAEGQIVPDEYVSSQSDQILVRGDTVRLIHAP